jgi:hypothetical protein
MRRFLRIWRSITTYYWKNITIKYLENGKLKNKEFKTYFTNHGPMAKEKVSGLA